MLICCVFFLRCEKKREYPLEIIKKEFQTEYDLAAWNIRMLYLLCADKEGEKLVLQSRLPFKSIHEEDQYVYINFEVEELAQLVVKSQCSKFYGLGFDKDGMMRLAQDDLWISDYREPLLNRDTLRLKLKRNKTLLAEPILSEAYRRNLL